jgi:hypothetical protein
MKGISSVGKRVRAGLACVALVAVAMTVLTGCRTSTATGPASGANLPTGVASASVSAPDTCHERTEGGQALPDPSCTPGATNPQVTQANLKETACKSGWTKTVRPPVSDTDRLKKEQIAAYGYTDTRMGDYEENHLVSLELGGAPSDPHNLWPEPGASPNPKDKVENDLHAALCSGKITLAAAQRAIATDWTTAEHQLGLG